MKEPSRKNFDLILCRNVMIYFSKESQQHIHMNFFRALRKGGYFITGKSEMLSGEPSRVFLPVDVQTRVYQKPKVGSDGVQFGVAQPASASSILLNRV